MVVLYCWQRKGTLGIEESANQLQDLHSMVHSISSTVCRCISVLAVDSLQKGELDFSKVTSEKVNRPKIHTASGPGIGSHIALLSSHSEVVGEVCRYARCRDVYHVLWHLQLRMLRAAGSWSGVGNKSLQVLHHLPFGSFAYNFFDIETCSSLFDKGLWFVRTSIFWANMRKLCQALSADSKDSSELDSFDLKRM